jgi:hypothetical protein
MWPLEPRRHHIALSICRSPTNRQCLLVWPIQEALDNKEGGFDIQVDTKPLEIILPFAKILSACNFGAGDVTEVRFPCMSYTFVVTRPSGSVTVSTSPKLLYVYEVVAVCVPASGIDSDSKLFAESW